MQETRTLAQLKDDLKIMMAAERYEMGSTLYATSVVAQAIYDAASRGSIALSRAVLALEPREIVALVPEAVNEIPYLTIAAVKEWLEHRLLPVA